MKKKQKQIVWEGGIVICVILLLLSLIIAGCASISRPVDTSDQWQTALLTDVRSGKTFSIADLKGQPVLIQTFTITCPVCMQQQAEISKLHATGEVGFVMVGLDIDPNSDAASLHAYTKSNDYYGLYASSPPELTRSLASQFGMLVLSPAQAPLILVCPDGSAVILRPGVKTSGELQQVLTKGCPE
ncbi:MAG: redoxin family protein [Methanoregulaceae archaeon]|nr:redoxin family protein [Methanoregulaceae archaeon]